MRRHFAIGALIAAVGGVIAWWMISGADSPGAPAPAAGSSAGREATSDSAAIPAARVESPPEVRGEWLQQSGQLTEQENQAPANAQPTADAAVSSEPRKSSPVGVTPGETQPEAGAAARPQDKTRFPTQWRCGGWMGDKSRREYQAFADSSTAWSGSFSARIESRVVGPEFSGAGCYQGIAADDFKGRRVEFSLYMRTLEARPGAHLVFRADGDDRELAVYDMESRWVRGSAGWARHSVVIDVPYRTSIIVLGAMLVNTGTLWIDEASLQIVGSDTPLTQPSRAASQYGWLPDPGKFPTALQNGGFEDTIEVPPSP